VWFSDLFEQFRKYRFFDPFYRPGGGLKNSQNRDFFRNGRGVVERVLRSQIRVFMALKSAKDTQGWFSDLFEQFRKYRFFDPFQGLFGPKRPFLGQNRDFFEMGVESWNGSYAAKSGFLWPKKVQKTPRGGFPTCSSNFENIDFLTHDPQMARESTKMRLAWAILGVLCARFRPFSLFGPTGGLTHGAGQGNGLTQKPCGPDSRNDGPSRWWNTYSQKWGRT
jgi:hypothetical protein